MNTKQLFVILELHTYATHNITGSPDKKEKHFCLFRGFYCVIRQWSIINFAPSSLQKVLLKCSLLDSIYVKQMLPAFYTYEF
jgi:hypothetical protein